MGDIDVHAMCVRCPCVAIESITYLLVSNFESERTTSSMGMCVADRLTDAVLQGMGVLQALSSLQLDNNQLVNAGGAEALTGFASTLTNLDLSYNQLSSNALQVPPLFQLDDFSCDG